MTWEEAIKYCEEHECEECPAFIEDRRTDYRKKALHYPCCWNLVDDEDEENKIPIGLWYKDTDKRKLNEEMIYRKPNGEEYMWKDDIWKRIK